MDQRTNAAVLEPSTAPTTVEAIIEDKIVCAADVQTVVQGNRFSLSRIDWSAAIPILILHAGCIAAPFVFSWSGLGIAIAFWWLTGGLGICLCYHRLLTHRSFKTPKWFEYFLTILGTMCWQGGPIKWVGEHRIHHKHSDHDEDPHSPKHGFNWAHALWCVTKCPEGYKPREAAKDLQRDPGLAFIDKHHYIWQFILAGLFMGVGTLVGGWMMGLSWVVWGVCVRTVFTFHATWFVNSAAHTWGYRNYETTDDSRNNWWVALLSFGEGWHNNHHASQRAAAHGRRWFEFDITYLTIRVLGLFGLAREIQAPKV
jgi:stearoyl-CoA desaturase (delta-9 desaturase)